MVGGVPGSGKSTVSKLLNQSLEASVWLDGDWCWMMDPFVVNDENKDMVEKNILYILNAYIHNKNFEHIIFSWVLHQQELIDRLLEGLALDGLEVFNFSLICDDKVLEERMIAGNRGVKQMKKSMQDLRKYSKLTTDKVDVSALSPKEAVDEIKMRIIKDLFARG